MGEYVDIAFQCIAVGAAAGCIVILVGHVFFSVLRIMKGG